MSMKMTVIADFETEVEITLSCACAREREREMGKNKQLHPVTITHAQGSHVGRVFNAVCLFVFSRRCRKKRCS